MQIGAVIRKYRKNRSMTQEEVGRFIEEANDRLKNGDFQEVFQWAKKQLERYPNCEPLIYRMALLLDAWHLAKKIPISEDVESYIRDCYVRTLDSRDEKLRNQAADALFGYYQRKEQYAKAEKYLVYFSEENPERKRKQAVIYSKMGRLHDAYRTYEELLFSGYQMLSLVCNSIYMLAMQENDFQKAHILVEKQEALAKVFEMGEYHEISSRLDLATAEKDAKAVMEIMEKMLASVEKICDLCKSSLYEHMEFKAPKDEFLAEIRENLRRCFQDEETYSFLKTDKRWQELVCPVS